jgi:class 3 adenylate cyclase/tetratricopeptide (TPR) repeat protein
MSWYTAIQEDLQALSRDMETHSPETPRLRKGERRDVAVLFLDLKDFTSMSEDMDHESVHRLVNGVMKILSDVVQGHGGYVDKIEGDRIMALFGATAAGENDSARAVDCSMRMLETIQQANSLLSDRGLSIGVRAGISFGSVTVAPDALGHTTAMGDTVNVASRMETSAEPGTVLVSDSVFRECMDLFEWESLGEVSVKGRHEPVPVHRPRGPGSARLERWEKAMRVPGAPLIGRDGELRSLMASWASPDTGQRNPRGGPIHLVNGISGEAGSGKSRLASEFVSTLRDGEPFRILRGYALPYAQPPFQLWISTLHDMAGTADGGGFEPAILERLADGCRSPADAEALQHSIPFLEDLLRASAGNGKLPDLNEKSLHRERILAIRNLLRALLCSGRCLMVLEDMQWMDSPSRETLDFVLANLDTEHRGMFLCIYRNDGEEAPPVIRDTPREYASTGELVLDPLDDEGCREMVGAMLGEDVPDDVVSFIRDRSRGNPLFIEELVVDLIESDVLQETGEGWVFRTDPAALSIPSSIRGIVRARIDRLPAHLREGLQYASVLGGCFGADLFRRLHSRFVPEGDPEAMVDELCGSGFLNSSCEGGTMTCSFRNSMVRETAYAMLLVHNRRILHGYAARAMLELGMGSSASNSPAIARHFELSDDSVEAVTWGYRALEVCRTGYDNEEGLSWADRLAGILDGMPRSEENDLRLVNVLLSRERILNLLGRREEQKKVLHRILELCSGDRFPGRRAVALKAMGSVYSYLGPPEKAEEYYRASLDLARSIGDGHTEGVTLCSLGILQSQRGDTVAARESFRRSLELAGDSSSLQLRGAVLGNIGNSFLHTGDLDEALDYFHRAIDVCREAGERHNEAGLLGNIGNVFLRGGRLDEAEEHLSRALAIHCETGNRRAEGIALQNLAEVQRARGELDTALDTAAMALEIHRETGYRWFEALVLRNIGNTFGDLGNSGRAMEYLDRALAIFGDLENPSEKGYTLLDEARLLLARGVPGEVEPLLDEAFELFDRAASDRGRFHVHLLRARMEHERGDRDAGLSCMARAADLAGAVGLDPEEAGELDSVRSLFG